MSTRTFGVAIVGCGLIARFHARALAEVPGARLVALVSRKKANAEALAKSLELRCDCYDDLAPVLAREHPPAEPDDAGHAALSRTLEQHLRRLLARVEVRVGVDHAVVGASTRGKRGAAGSMPVTASVSP